MIFKRGVTAERRKKPLSFEISVVLNALPSSVLVLDDEDRIQYLNPAAEQLFSRAASQLCGMALVDVLFAESVLLRLIGDCRKNGVSIAEYDVTLDHPRSGRHMADLSVTPLSEEPGWIIVQIHEQSIAAKISQHLSPRHAVRSMTAMSALLAHEVKNPLSGIRGAAQLLEQDVAEPDRALTRLICEEADRIAALVDRMEVFSDERPLQRTAINIHGVLEHVRRLAEHGVARHVRFIEAYDPSLPMVDGNRDRLIQLFFNLVKNAAEAVAPQGGEITLSTAYQPGVRVSVPGSKHRIDLPLVVSVQDNGSGIPTEIRPHLFDAFVTSKSTGSGLGLALAAKIVNDHGGLIEVESASGKTVFRVILPIFCKESSRS